MSPHLSLVPRPTPLQSLVDERQALVQRLTDLQAAAGRVRTTEGEEAAILAEIGALADRHVAAIREWAQAGGQGEMPAQDPQEAHRLARRLVEVQTTAKAAAGALNDLEGSQRDLAAEIAALDQRIGEQALSDALASTAPGLERAQILARQAAGELAKVYGLAVAIRARAAALQGTGHVEAARPLFQHAEQIARTIPQLDVEASNAAVEQEATAWRTRLAEMTGGVL